MGLVRFPAGEAIMTGRPLEDGLFEEIDGLITQGHCPDGWLDLETPQARLTCLFHQSRTYLAGLTEEEVFSWVPLKDFPVRAKQLEGAVCNMAKGDPVRVLLLAVHFRNRPVLQATTDLVDLAHVLSVLADEGHDAALALEREQIRTLLFLQQGAPARAYFGDPTQDPGRGSVAERFLEHAFAPDAPLSKVEVFKRLSIEHDPDTGRTLTELAREAKPPPPMNVMVRLAGRVVLHRPFMPPKVRIGRDHACELLLDNLSVSRRHAELAWERGKFVIRDLDSANGTQVDGKRVSEHVLGTGDKIGIGKFELALVDPPDVRDPDPTMLLAPGAELGCAEAASSTLYLVGEDQSVPLDGEITIGKTRGVDLKARGFWVKAVHARIKAEGAGAYRLRCQGGTSVQLNGQTVSEGYLKAGDVLVVGRSHFRLTPSLASEPTGA